MGENSIEKLRGKTPTSGHSFHSYIYLGCCVLCSDIYAKMLYVLRLALKDDSNSGNVYIKAIVAQTFAYY